MLMNSLKCCSKHIGSTAVDFNLYSCGGTHRRWYAKSNKSGCCTNVPQTAGRNVEPWPKSEPPPPQWRCECPQDHMPYNNDPYRIKVPEVVVPPMPPGNAKRMEVVLTHTDPRDPLGMKDWAPQHNQNEQMPHNPSSQPQAEEEDDGFFAKLKKFFKGKNNQDQMTKELDVLRLDSQENKDFNYFTGEPTCQNFAPPPWCQNVIPKDVNEKFARNMCKSVVVMPKLGYHGQRKYKFAFHEPWNPLDRLSLIAQAEKDEQEHHKEIAAAEKEKQPCI